MNILILTGRFGMGHIKCAEALKELMLRDSTDARVDIVDLIEYLYPHSARPIYRTFGRLVSGCSGLYNQLNILANNGSCTPFSKIFRKRMEALTERFRPDLVIVNLPICVQYFGAYKQMSGDPTPMYVFVTDITLHSEWISPEADLYFVGGLSTRDALISHGVRQSIIHVSGIPVSEAFECSKDPICSELRAGRTEGGKSAAEILTCDKPGAEVQNCTESTGAIPDNIHSKCLKLYSENLSTEKIDNKINYSRKSGSNVLVMGGGLGMIPGGKRTLAVLSNLDDLHITLVCGSNQKLMRCASSKYPAFNIIGCCDRVAQLMKQADVLITKPGGITTFEAIKSETPLFIIDPTLEHEKDNARFIEDNKIGRVIYGKNTFTSRDLRDFLGDAELLSNMRNNMHVMKENMENQNPLDYFSEK